MHGRLLIGLSVGSGCEAADAVAVRTNGSGLDMAPHVVGTARVPLPPEVRAAGRRLARAPEPWPAGVGAEVVEALAAASTRAAAAAGDDLRSAFAVGLLTRLPELTPDAAALADRLAERTGVTVVSGFAGRDVAAGGSGSPITAAADFLLFADPTEGRAIVHLGSACSAVHLPAGVKLSDVSAVVAGPGLRLLDDITSVGTRGKEAFDPGGTKGVQGRCLDALLAGWLARPASRAGGPAFLVDAFDAVRAAGGTLHDLLCTATHFVARCVAAACGPPGRRVLVSGGGVRNGLLWKLLTDQRAVERTDAVGVPATARTAAAAAVLAGLTLDGVAANLPLVTGAAGGRLVGRLTPGDPRNWAACTAWMADHLAGYAGLRAA